MSCANSQVELVTSNGSIVETSGSNIMAPQPDRRNHQRNFGDIDLNQNNGILGFAADPNNMVAATNNVVGGAITIYGFTVVGAITDSVLGLGTITGLTTVNSTSGSFTNIISFSTNAFITISAPIDAGSAAVELGAERGITESSGDGITGGSLALLE